MGIVMESWLTVIFSCESPAGDSSEQELYRHGWRPFPRIPDQSAPGDIVRARGNPGSVFQAGLVL